MARLATGPPTEITSSSAPTPVMPHQAGLVSLSTAVNASARCNRAWMNAYRPTGIATTQISIDR